MEGIGGPDTLGHQSLIREEGLGGLYRKKTYLPGHARWRRKEVSSSFLSLLSSELGMLCSHGEEQKDRQKAQGGKAGISPLKKAVACVTPACLAWLACHQSSISTSYTGMEEGRGGGRGRKKELPHILLHCLYIEGKTTSSV